MVSFVCNHKKCQKSSKNYKKVEDLHQHLTKVHLLVKCYQCNDDKFYNRKNLKKTYGKNSSWLGHLSVLSKTIWQTEAFTATTL